MKAKETTNKVVVVNDKDGHLSKILSASSPCEVEITNLPSLSISDTIARVKEIIPDLIMICIHGKNLVDVHLCKELKRESDTGDIPVVFVSKDHAEGAIEKTAFIYGCIDFLTENEEGCNITDKLRQYMMLGKIERGLKGVLKKLGESRNAKS